MDSLDEFGGRLSAARVYARKGGGGDAETGGKILLRHVDVFLELLDAIFHMRYVERVVRSMDVTTWAALGKRHMR